MLSEWLLEWVIKDDLGPGVGRKERRNERRFVHHVVMYGLREAGKEPTAPGLIAYRLGVSASIMTSLKLAFFLTRLGVDWSTSCGVRCHVKVFTLGRVGGRSKARS